MIDRKHTFEKLARFFEATRGVPRAMRIDRMGALGNSVGKRCTLFAPTVEFTAGPFGFFNSDVEMLSRHPS